MIYVLSISAGKDSTALWAWARRTGLGDVGGVVGVRRRRVAQDTGWEFDGAPGVPSWRETLADLVTRFEHPAETSAWRRFGLRRPRRLGCGWSGHRARKPTWLYAYGVDHPPLRWGPAASREPYSVLGHVERAATPPAFRDVLLSIARSARREAHG